MQIVLWCVRLLAFAFVVITSPASHAAGLEQFRVALDFGNYRGYWRIESALGVEVAHDECFTQRVCRESIKALTEGDYVLVLTGQPQSTQIRFRLQSGTLLVTSGASLATADNLNLRLKGLRRVSFNTNGYRGEWSLDLWNGAAATGFFKQDGGEQTIDLFPGTTYALRVGPLTAERFQIGTDDKIILIDDSGVARVSAEAANKLTFQTIDAAIYPAPKSDTAKWSIEGIPVPDSRPAFIGPAMVRLLQGATYKLMEAPGNGKPSTVSFLTGKACNMSENKLRLPAMTVQVVPISMSCTSAQPAPAAEPQQAVPRRKKSQ